MPGIFGDIGSTIGGFFNKNPGHEANDYLKQIPGAIKPYYDPYINAGRQDLNTLQQQYGQMVNDPNALYSKFGKGFQQSPGYQFQVDQATKAANSAASAGGMLGTPAEQQQLAGTVGGLANQDFYNYMNQIMNLYGGGLGGMSHIMDQGYNASNTMAQSLANALGGQAGAAYQGTNWQNQQNMNMGQSIGNILGGNGNFGGGQGGGGMGNFFNSFGGG
jgi:hypothetical protein